MHKLDTTVPSSPSWHRRFRSSRAKARKRVRKAKALGNTASSKDILRLEGHHTVPALRVKRPRLLTEPARRPLNMPQWSWPAYSPQQPFYKAPWKKGTGKAENQHAKGSASSQRQAEARASRLEWGQGSRQQQVPKVRSNSNAAAAHHGNCVDKFSHNCRRPSGQRTSEVCKPCAQSRTESDWVAETDPDKTAAMGILSGRDQANLPEGAEPLSSGSSSLADRAERRRGKPSRGQSGGSQRGQRGEHHGSPSRRRQGPAVATTSAELGARRKSARRASYRCRAAESLGSSDCQALHRACRVLDTIASHQDRDHHTPGDEEQWQGNCGRWILAKHEALGTYETSRCDGRLHGRGFSDVFRRPTFAAGVCRSISDGRPNSAYSKVCCSPSQASVEISRWSAKDSDQGAWPGQSSAAYSKSKHVSCRKAGSKEEGPWRVPRYCQPQATREPPTWPQRDKSRDLRRRRSTTGCGGGRRLRPGDVVQQSRCRAASICRRRPGHTWRWPVWCSASEYGVALSESCDNIGCALPSAICQAVIAFQGKGFQYTFDPGRLHWGYGDAQENGGSCIGTESCEPMFPSWLADTCPRTLSSYHAESGLFPLASTLLPLSSAPEQRGGELCCGDSTPHVPSEFCGARHQICKGTCEPEQRGGELDNSYVPHVPSAFCAWCWCRDNSNPEQRGGGSIRFDLAPHVPSAFCRWNCTDQPEQRGGEHDWFYVPHVPSAFCAWCQIRCSSNPEQRGGGSLGRDLTPHVPTEFCEWEMIALRQCCRYGCEPAHLVRTAFPMARCFPHMPLAFCGWCWCRDDSNPEQRGGGSIRFDLAPHVPSAFCGWTCTNQPEQRGGELDWFYVPHVPSAFCAWCQIRCSSNTEQRGGGSFGLDLTPHVPTEFCGSWLHLGNPADMGLSQPTLCGQLFFWHALASP